MVWLLIKLQADLNHAERSIVRMDVFNRSHYVSNITRVSNHSNNIEK